MRVNLAVEHNGDNDTGPATGAPGASARAVPAPATHPGIGPSALRVRPVRSRWALLLTTVAPVGPFVLWFAVVDHLPKDWVDLAALPVLPLSAAGAAQPRPNG